MAFNVYITIGAAIFFSFKYIWGIFPSSDRKVPEVVIVYICKILEN